MTEYYEDPYSNFIENMFHSMDSNGYGGYIKKIREYVATKEGIRPDFDWVSVPEWIFPGDDTPHEDREVLQIFWSFLINEYGCCGVTERSGWVEDRQAALDFLDYGIAVSGLDFDYQDYDNPRYDQEREEKTTDLSFDDWKASRK